MPLLIYPATPPPIHPSAHRDDDPTIIVAFAGSSGEQRASRTGRKLRTYHLRYRTTNTRRAILDAFFESVRQSATSFLFKDLNDYTRTGITLEPATSDGVVTAFSLPTTGQYAGDYPVDDANAKLYRAGVLVTGTTTQVDARTITKSPAPSAGGAMTADYHYYRRVRLVDPPTWEHAPYGVWACDLSLVEVSPS